MRCCGEGCREAAKENDKKQRIRCKISSSKAGDYMSYLLHSSVKIGKLEYALLIIFELNNISLHICLRFWTLVSIHLKQHDNPIRQLLRINEYYKPLTLCSYHLWHAACLHLKLHERLCGSMVNLIAIWHEKKDFDKSSSWEVIRIHIARQLSICFYMRSTKLYDIMRINRLRLTFLDLVHFVINMAN